MQEIGVNIADVGAIFSTVAGLETAKYRICDGVCKFLSLGGASGA